LRGVLIDFAVSLLQDPMGAWMTHISTAVTYPLRISCFLEGRPGASPAAAPAAIRRRLEPPFYKENPGLGERCEKCVALRLRHQLIRTLRRLAARRPSAQQQPATVVAAAAAAARPSLPPSPTCAAAGADQAAAPIIWCPISQASPPPAAMLCSMAVRQGLAGPAWLLSRVFNPPRHASSPAGLLSFILHPTCSLLDQFVRPAKHCDTLWVRSGCSTASARFHTDTQMVREAIGTEQVLQATVTNQCIVLQAQSECLRARVQICARPYRYNCARVPNSTS